MSGQKMKLNKQVKHFGVILQDDLRWNNHLSNLKKTEPCHRSIIKSKTFVSKYLPRTISYSLFNSHLIHACEIKGQNQNNTLFQRITLYNTRTTNNYQLDFPTTRTTHYGTYSFRKKAAEAWNQIQRTRIPNLRNCVFTDFRKEIL